MSIQTEINRLNTAKESIRNEFKKIGLDIPSDTKLDDYYLYIAEYNTMILDTINNYWKKIYPIGSIIETEDLDFDPNVEFGGTWERTLKGKFPVGYDPNDTDFNTVGKTGGSKQFELQLLTGGNTFGLSTGAIGYGGKVLINETQGNGGYITKQINTVPPYEVVAKWVRKA